jgi:hypothetical protein
MIPSSGGRTPKRKPSGIKLSARSTRGSVGGSSGTGVSPQGKQARLNGSASGALGGAKGTGVAKAGKQAQIDNIAGTRANRRPTPKNPVASGAAAGARAGGKIGTSNTLQVAKGAIAGAKAGGKIGTKAGAAQALPMGGGAEAAYDFGGGGPGAAGGSPGKSILDGLTAPDVSKILASTSKSAATKSLQSYIKESLKDLGPGTDYSGIKNQLNKDTSKADSKVNAMYTALTLGIRANDPVLKGIYDDASKQMQASGSQAQSTVRSAYNDAAGSVAQRIATVGATDGDGVTAQWAAQDQANSQASLAENQQTALDANTGHETAARVRNVDQSTGAGFQGAETRSGIAQSLADNLAKLKVQQSTEDASRRSQALQMAISRQGNDQQAAAAAQQAALDAANTSFSQKLSLASLGLKEEDTRSDNARGDYNSQVDAASKAANAQLGRDRLNSSNSNAAQRNQLDRQKLADANALALAKLKSSTAGQSKSRKAAALANSFKLGVDKGGIDAKTYQKQINALG